MARCFRYLQNFRYIIVELTIFARFRFKFRLQHAYLACVAAKKRNKTGGCNSGWCRIYSIKRPGPILKVLDLDSGSRESGYSTFADLSLLSGPWGVTFSLISKPIVSRMQVTMQVPVICFLFKERSEGFVKFSGIGFKIFCFPLPVFLDNLSPVFCSNVPPPSL